MTGTTKNTVENLEVRNEQKLNRILVFLNTNTIFQ